MNTFFKMVMLAGAVGSIVYVVKLKNKNEETVVVQPVAKQSDNEKKEVGEIKHAKHVSESQTDQAKKITELPKAHIAKDSIKQEPQGRQNLLPMLKIVEINVPVLQQKTSIPWEEEANLGNFGPDGHIAWINVREEETLNCGYHSVKNCKVALFGLDANIDIARDESILGQFVDLERFIKQLRHDVPEIFTERKNNIDKDLARSNIPIPENFQEYT